MKITDVVMWGWEKYAIEEELPLPHTEERFIEHFELNGKMVMNPEGIQEEYGGVGFNFSCGPAEDYNCMSGVYISEEYLGGICKDLNIEIFLHDAENYHRLEGAKSFEEAMEQFNRIKERISQDFEIDIDRD
jgi:hypothetical protein